MTSDSCSAQNFRLLFKRWSSALIDVMIWQMRRLKTFQKEGYMEYFVGHWHWLIFLLACTRFLILRIHIWLVFFLLLQFRWYFIPFCEIKTLHSRIYHFSWSSLRIFILVVSLILCSALSSLGSFFSILLAIEASQ